MLDGRYLLIMRDALCPELRKAHFQACFLLEGADPVRQSLCSGEASLAAKRLQAVIGIDAYETVQRKGAGFAVRKMPVLAQRIAAGMAAGGLRQGKGETG